MIWGDLNFLNGYLIQTFSVPEGLLEIVHKLFETAICGWGVGKREGSGRSGSTLHISPITFSSI